MPSFSIRTVQDLSDFLNPVTPAMANEIIAEATANEDGETTAAIYFTSVTGKRVSILLIVGLINHDDDYLAQVWTGEYHPRKDGKASLIFNSSYVSTF
jgi:hypothetical protein